MARRLCAGLILVVVGLQAAGCAGRGVRTGADTSLPGEWEHPEGSEGWPQLLREGPGRDAVLTLVDGTLRSGRIQSVDGDGLTLLVVDRAVPVPRSEIAQVKVRTPGNRGLGGLVLGIAVGGLDLPRFGGRSVSVVGPRSGMSRFEPTRDRRTTAL